MLQISLLWDEYRIHILTIKIYGNMQNVPAFPISFTVQLCVCVCVRTQ